MYRKNNKTAEAVAAAGCVCVIVGGFLIGPKVGFFVAGAVLLLAAAGMIEEGSRHDY